MHRSQVQPTSSASHHRALPRQLPKLTHHEPHHGSPSASTTSSVSNGLGRSSLLLTETNTPPSHSTFHTTSANSASGTPHSIAQSTPKVVLPSLQRLGSGSFMLLPNADASLARPTTQRRSLRIVDTRNNRPIEGAPNKWKDAGKPSQAPAKSIESKASAQSYQQFISLKILLAESRRYAWENIVLRHPEASSDEVLVYQFNSTWGQLMDDVTSAIVERQVPNVSAASSIVNMMELFQRHSPAVDLLPDATPPIGPRHLPIDWFEAQRQDVRSAVVEERQARKGRAALRAMTPSPTRTARRGR